MERGPQTSSVGAPELQDAHGVGPPPPASTGSGRSRYLAVVAVAVALAAGAWWLAREPEPEPASEEPDPSGAAVADIRPAPPDDEVQRRLESGPDRYRVRPAGLVPVGIATHSPEGFVGLGRWQGVWYVAGSDDGIDWVLDLGRPLEGVPAAFRPGALEGQYHVSLQWVDGAYWGRFVSRRTAGAARAALVLTSEDAQTWSNSRLLPAGLDEREVGPIRVGARAGWVQRWVGGSSIQQSFDGGDTYHDIPGLGPGDWELLDVATGEAGIATLYYADRFDSWRLALSGDGRRWETVALAERGRNAVRLTVVGDDSVLAAAADPDAGPVELIVPFESS